MRKIALRFAAYLLAGSTLGGAAFVALQFDAPNSVGVLLLVLVTAGCGAIATIILLARTFPDHAGGLRTTHPVALTAMDAICVISSVVTCFLIFDGYAVWLVDHSPMIGEPLLSDVMAFMFLPSALILAGFITSSGSQSVSIDETGISVSGHSETIACSWQDVDSLKANEQYIVVSRVGIPVPKRLRVNLDIVLANGDEITIYEPGLRSAKKAVLKKLRAHAPERLDENLSELAQHWR